MALDYFNVGLDIGAYPDPNTQYRDLQQAFQNQQWDNTTALYTIEEQDEIGTFTFHRIEAWLAHVVGMTSTGTKEGRDFIKLLFRDIEHPCLRGLYYKLDNNYWIGDFTDPYDSVQKSMSIRRCNNYLRCIDPDNGSIFSIPCVIDYDMTSPSQQVSSYVITPNNCAHVMVQGNADTYRLFKTNTRFMLAGRPFKLLAYQNAMMYDIEHEHETLLYFDLYLDVIHPEDDVENGLAYNGVYDYKITIDANDMELPIGSKGQLTASITLNGKEVSRDIAWVSSNYDAIDIDENGNYEVLKKPEDNKPVNILAILKGNVNVSSGIFIGVSDSASSSSKIIVEPSFNVIRQYESIDFTVGVTNGSEIDYEAGINVKIPNDSKNYLELESLGGNKYRLTCIRYSTEPKTIVMTLLGDEEVKYQMQVNCVSMLG